MNNDQEGTSNQQPGRGTIKKTNMDFDKTPPAATNSNSSATNNSCETEKEELENKNHHGAIATDSPRAKDNTENR